MRKMKIALIIICLGLVVSVLISRFSAAHEKPKEDAFLTFLTKHPAQSSISFIHNERTFEHNSFEPFPLASAVKTIIAIEYATQVSKGMIDPNEKVALKTLNAYYIGLDGDAHYQWQNSLKEEKKVRDNRVTIEEIAKGMIQFSSNANAEYLIERLGLPEINAQLNRLNLNNHTPINAFGGSPFIPYEVMKGNITKKNKEEAKKKVHKLSQREWNEYALTVHQKLKEDVNGEYKQKVNIESWYDRDFDRMFTDRFTTGTTHDYVQLMNRLNNRELSLKVHQYLDPLLEWPMKLPQIQQDFQRFGAKGGSTAYVLTDALYATSKDGEKTAVAIFLQDLTPSQQEKLQQSIEAFEYRLLTDAAYQTEVEKQLSGEK
ncbi:serine hydrolase [Priestia koreensis]|uniref:serine hydrolase n=1 Tax=Priestia koreensis TaxID=284581 RepID=UPI0034592371